MSSTTRLFIAGPSGPLEAVVEEPDFAAASSIALVCHPHPLHGGTMDNKVVTSVARALRDAGMPTVRFNFRGVGQSEGVYDEGNGETADGAAVAHWALGRWPGRSMVVAGFSFGAHVAWRLAREFSLAHLITVAPPVQRFDFPGSAAPSCPWLLVQGEADEVVDSSAVIAWANRFDPPPALILMPGVGHFFHGKLLELRNSIEEVIRSH